MYRTTLRFDRRELRLHPTPGGLALALSGGELRVPPGGPALPGRTVHIALAADQRPGRLLARALHTEPLVDGPTLVRPQPRRGVGVEQARLRPTAPPPLEYVPPDPALYAAAPEAPLAELVGVSWAGGVPVATVHVRPLRVTELGGLELVTALELELRSTPRRRPARHGVRLSLASPRAVRAQDWVARRVLNPEQVPQPPAQRASQPPAPAGAGGTGGTEAETPAIGLDGAPLPGLAAIPPGAAPREVDYLVITDDFAWDAAAITAGAALPGVVAAFAPLLAHKRARGLRTHLATISDIVRGAYGDHRTGARDLQEVIRRFLQAFVSSRGVEWVVLGGDHGLVPARLACGSVCVGVFGAATGTAGGPKVPKVGEYALRDTYLALRLADDVDTNPGQWGQPTHILTMLGSGKVVPHSTTASTSLCWFYTTDDTYSTASATPTRYARVNGPLTTLQDEPQWYGPDNLIPTDQYYAGLYGDNDLRPGRHDWDQKNTGLYGQWSRTANLGGAELNPDVSVGRIAAKDAAGVQRYVAKLIQYETADQRLDEVARFRKALYVAENWGGMVRLEREGGDAVPPGGWRYSHLVGTDTTLLRAEDFTKLPIGNVYAYLNALDRRELPYNDTGTGRGWCFVVSEVDHSPSVELLNLFFFSVPVPKPTPWILVRSGVPDELTPQHYLVDGGELDGSISDVEKLREHMATHHPRVSDVQRLYSDEGDLNPGALAAAPLAHLTRDRLESELNEGPHLVVLSGHGNWPGCCMLDVWRAPLLTNGNRTFIATADSCLTAQFDSADSLGEVLTVGHDQGAVAYIGNSRYSWIGLGTKYQLDFLERWGPDAHLGLMVDMSRLRWTAGPYERWVSMSLHVMGCPELPVWRDDRDALPHWIGNRRTLELHERHCPWVGRMSVRNMRRFDAAEPAWAAGYDGCGFCMRERHTR